MSCAPPALCHVAKQIFEACSAPPLPGNRNLLPSFALSPVCELLSYRRLNYAIDCGLHPHRISEHGQKEFPRTFDLEGIVFDREGMAVISQSA